MSSNRVTLKEIADATGFSPNTVSRALRNQLVISEETRSLIQNKASEMGYVPNRAASILRSGESHLVAFIVENLVNPFFGAIFEYLDKAASKYGYTVIVFSSHGTPEGELCAIRNAYAQNVDGILLITCDETGHSVEEMQHLHIPHVLLFRDLPDCKSAFVLQDEYNGGVLAFQYLLNHGCNRFAFACEPWICHSIGERKRGFCDAYDAFKLNREESELFIIKATIDDGMKKTAEAILSYAEHIFYNNEKSTLGICTFCDSAAYGLIGNIKKCNISLLKKLLLCHSIILMT